LYLVPGTILAVIICSLIKNEFKLMWEFNEEVFILKEEKEDEKDKKLK